MQLDFNCHEVYNVSDVGFIMDESGSINADDWKAEKTFVERLTREFKILPLGAHASVITFDDAANLDIKFSDYETNGDFESALHNISQGEGMTNIELALKVSLDQMFQEQHGMRPASPHVAVLITDGKANEGNLKFSTLRGKFEARSIKILVVGVGDVKIEELHLLVESPQNDFLYIKDFSNLDINDFINNTTFCKYKLR